jgi:bifunctional oligoribonuclease and PAP phosphatase NrnA
VKREGAAGGAPEASGGKHSGRARAREILTVVADDHSPDPDQSSAGPRTGGDLTGPGIEAEWSRAVKILDGASAVCLACHVRPDGDALGSMLAVAHALRGRGPRVVASFGDRPFEIPRILRFLPGAELLSPPDLFPARPPVMVTFDAASPDRLGLLEPNAAAADELIVLDHHASNTGFGTVNLVDAGAAATAVLACELIDRIGAQMSRDIALGLYAGLVTDTGSFKHPTTSARVHQMAARLLDTGIEPGVVARELWDRSPFAFLGLLSAALGRARLEPAAAAGHGLVWTTVTRGDRAGHGLPFEIAESVIDVVRRTDEADVAVVLKEDDDGLWQVSTRSKGAADVGRACVALGGGGHPLAAGFTAGGTPAEVMTRLREQLAAGPGAP